MKIELTTGKKADIEIILLNKKGFQNCEDKKILESLDFKPSLESCVVLPESGKIYSGYESSEGEEIKLAIAEAIKKFNSTNFKTAKVQTDKTTLSAIVEGASLCSYSYERYKSEKKEKNQTLKVVVSKATKELKTTFQEALDIASSVNMVRDFVNTPPEDFYPQTMADEALKIASDNDIECIVYDTNFLQSSGMNAMLSVARASRYEAKLIHLAYKPKKSKAKVILVGKGLTYDSGGLSLKPSDFMVTMKCDKSGGSAVLGIVNAVAKLGLDVEVHGIVGAVENMIGGDAYKPDDVLTAKNGTTIEVRNTDAEGRLVLADCLCYAQDTIKEFDYILDFATLTGACVVGVGQYTSGIMGNNTNLNHKIIQSASSAGELTAYLPFNRYLAKTLKSNIADVCNISNTRYGGAITAGQFLEKFIEKKNKDKWVHIDIAGPAFVESNWGYNPHGATGAGVRMAVEFMKSL